MYHNGDYMRYLKRPLYKSVLILVVKYAEWRKSTEQLINICHAMSISMHIKLKFNIFYQSMKWIWSIMLL